MRITLVALLGLTVVLGGCFSPTAAEQAVGPVFPAGCGPRHAAQPPASAVPASPAPLGRTLPIYGGPVPSHGLSAAGGMVVASTVTAQSGPDPLYVSTDDGRSWAPLPTPPGMVGPLNPVVMSADGPRLAGTDLHHLFVLRQLTPKGPPPTWVSHPVQNLFALAFDPADPNRIVGLGGDLAPQGHASVVYLSDDGGTTLRVRSVLPLPLGHGQALVVVDGTAIVALGQASGPVRVFAVPLAGGTSPELPQPPVVSPVYSLSADPGGSLYLITEGGLSVLLPRAIAWEQRPLPPGASNARGLYLAAASRQLYLATDDADARGTLWRADTMGGDWRPVAVPPGYVGQPVPDGRRVWVPTTRGPVLVRPDRDGEVRTTGIAAPVTVVASAAWRPTRVAAGRSGGLFFSDDGGRSWAYHTPPVSPIGIISEIAWTADGRCIAVIYGDGAQAFLSGDQGRTWWHLPGPAGGLILALTEWPVGSGTWWAVPGPYRSAPGRAVWTRVDLPPEASRRGNFIRLAPAPNGLWLGGSFGIWHLRLPPALGPTIARVWGAGLSWYGVVSNPYDLSVVYSGLRRTSNGGRTWDLPLPGPAHVRPEAAFRWMAFAPDRPGVVLSTGRALVRDDGRSWVPFWSPPAADQYTAGVAPAGPGRFYVAVQKLGLVVVEDSTTRWHTPASPPDRGRWTPPTGGPGPVPLEATAPSDPQTIYKLTPNGKLDVSRDGGRSFSALPVPALANGEACCSPAGTIGPRVVASVLAISPVDPNRLYIGLALDGAAAHQPELGLWASDDGGRSWRHLGFPRFAVEGIAIPSGSPDTLYAVAASRLWRSVDAGASWAPVETLPEAVYSIATPTATKVLVGGTAKVWRSEDGGLTFSPLPLGIPTWREPRPTSSSGLPVVAVLQAPTGTLFAGSGLGLARSRDGGRTWQVVSESVGDPPVLPGGLDLRADGSVAVATRYGTFVYRPVR